MPVNSMTGFARHEGDLPAGGRYAWELRSVNGRSLDIRFRVPAALDHVEPDLRRRATARLMRGNLQATLQITSSAAASSLRVNRTLLAELCAVADELVRAGHAAPPTADGLLALRGVLEGTDTAPSASDEASKARLVEAFETALDALAAARRDEGAALAAVLTRRLDEIERLAQRAEADPARSHGAIRDRLSRQVAALLETGSTLDPARLEQEAALIATKADIAEEIDRLNAHVETGRALLRSGEAVGRRLDFLAQEFNRESNTICSKSNAASLTAIGLELKVAVDQFREQVQNIE